MAKARKEGKKKRNRGNLTKNLKRIQKVNELLNKFMFQMKNVAKGFDSDSVSILEPELTLMQQHQAF
jgi:hypothetical protein